MNTKSARMRIAFATLVLVGNAACGAKPDLIPDNAQGALDPAQTGTSSEQPDNPASSAASEQAMAPKPGEAEDQGGPSPISMDGGTTSLADADGGTSPDAIVAPETGALDVDAGDGGAPSSSCSVAITNGDFESGSFLGWSLSSGFANTTTSSRHSGISGLQLGSTAPYSLDSVLSQKLQVPAQGATRLSFWYSPHCTGSQNVDRVRGEIRSDDGRVLVSLFDACINTTWTPAVVDLTPFAGQAVTLFFVADDNGDPMATFMFLDDFVLSCSAQ
jgi:hypothetical protein